MPTGQGPVLLRDETAVAAAVLVASKRLDLPPASWGPPAMYAQGRWPVADFSYVVDPQLRYALVTVQDWVRALRHARNDRRLSLRKVSVQARTPVNTLSEIELGARWASLPVMLRVSQVLGVSVDALVADD